MRTCSIALVMALLLAIIHPPIGGIEEAATLPVPNVTIVAPKNGSIVSGKRVEISVGFESDESHPVAKVEVHLDGKAVTKRVYDVPLGRGVCSFLWDTVRTGDGEHRLDIQIFSRSAYLGMATCVVTVSNEGPPPRRPLDRQPPEVRITSPRDGETVSGTIPVTVDARDDATRKLYVSIFVDKSLKSVRNYGPYAYKWDTSREENGPHVIEVVARDGAANRADAKPVRVIVRNAVKVIPFGSEQVREMRLPAPMTVPRQPSEQSAASAREYLRTVSGVVGVSTDGFEVTRSAAPMPNLPMLGGDPLGEARAAPDTLSVTSGSIPAPQPGQALGAEGPAATVLGRKPLVTTGSVSEGFAPGSTPASRAPVRSLSEHAKAPVPVVRLRESNIMFELRPGRRLSIPAPPSNNPEQPRSAERALPKAQIRHREYVVQVGDNLLRIADRFGVSARVLAEANELRDPDIVWVGQRLSVPGSSPEVRMVPLKLVFQDLGGSIAWDRQTRTVRADAPGISLGLRIGSPHASLNNMPVTMEKPAVVVGGRTLVPLSFVTNTLGISAARHRE